LCHIGASKSLASHMLNSLMSAQLAKTEGETEVLEPIGMSRASPAMSIQRRYASTATSEGVAWTCSSFCRSRVTYALVGMDILYQGKLDIDDG